MKNKKTRIMRISVQAAISIFLLLILILYNLYTSELIDFKLLSVGDLNPYGGWNSLKESVTDSSYEFEGISRSMALTIAILVAAIVGGRFFCGWICPVGAMQDLSSWIGNKAGIPRYKGVGKKLFFNPLYIKYPILLAVLMLSILGYGAYLAELSPWRALLNIPKLVSAYKEMWIGFLVMVAIIICALIVPRFFCKFLCPLGAAQTLLSSFSILTLKHNKGCGGCNKCLETCPVSIKISKDDENISPECIRCMDCIDNCRITTDISLGLKMGKRKISPKAYAAMTMLLFFVVWLGMPKLWGGSTMVSGIALNNLKDGVYQGEAKGFAARIITEVRIEGGKIADIKVIDHHESKGWYEEVFMILPKEIIRKQRIEADVISGATKTSKGFIKSVESAVRKAVDTEI